VLARQKPGEIVHVLLDRFLEAEENAGAALRIERGPVA
jgi:hypothetical protein